MTGLETALAATGFKILGEELVEWLKNRGSDLKEDDWEEMGLHIGRKLIVDFENIQSSWLHKSRKKSVVKRIEAAAEIYRELELIGTENDFSPEIVGMYSELADVCSKWSVQTAGFGQEEYEELGAEYVELQNEYKELVR